NLEQQRTKTVDVGARVDQVKPSVRLLRRSCAEIEDERSSEQAYSGSRGLRDKPRLAAGEIRPTCSCWGRLYCPAQTRGGCIVTVYSTPRVPENHARYIRRRVDACPH
ncbi:MAG TPA: hypothetical protein VKI17_02700, partial [Gemmataceae bacterium]|nr:hypothetical protein [Gemmataceae bacterium]